VKHKSISIKKKQQQENKNKEVIAFNNILIWFSRHAVSPCYLTITQRWDMSCSVSVHSFLPESSAHASGEVIIRWQLLQKQRIK
jgi:hypothetical protein